MKHTETTRAKSPESWGWAVEHPDPPVPKWWVPSWAHKFVQYKWARRITIGTPITIGIACYLFPRVAFVVGLCALDIIRQDWDTRIHRKRVVKPLAKAIAPVLGIRWQSHLKWLHVPVDMDDDEANAVIRLPHEWAGHEEQRVELSAIVNRRLPGQWEPHFHFRDFTVELTHPPPPPDVYDYDPTLPTVDGLIPIGVASRGKLVEINFDEETPHIAVIARTGWGKSVTMRGVIARFRKAGGLVDICDPKRISLMEFRDVPGIEYHTGIDRMLAAIHNFYLEVERRYKIVEKYGEGALDPKEFPRRLLALEELGSLTTEGKMKWRQDGKTGMPDFVMDYARILWQGRAAKMHVLVGAHEASADVFINNDLRGQFGLIIAAGPQNLGSWRKMFGNEPHMKSRNKKGAAIAGKGDELLRFHIQNMSRELARSEALSASVHAESGDPLPPAETLSSVHGQPDTSPLVVGLKAGAEFLGMKPDAFIKARLRAPGKRLPGEQREGRFPAWTEDALRAWQHGRTRAGRDAA